MVYDYSALALDIKTSNYGIPLPLYKLLHDKKKKTKKQIETNKTKSYLLCDQV